MNYRGSISIFFSIVLLTLIVFCFSIVDFTRIQIAQVQGTRAISLATKSVMANFDSQLALEYGLFGLQGDDQGGIATEIQYYMENSLSPENALNGYHLGQVTTEEMASFVDAEYVNKQIMNYMKLRGPYLALEAFMKEMDFFSKATKTAEIISLNNQVADQLKNINTNYTQLEKLVDGILFDEQQVPMSVYGSPEVYPGFIKKMAPTEAAYDAIAEKINIPDASLKEAIINQVYSLPEVVDQVYKHMDEGSILGSTFVNELASYVTLEKNLSILETDLSDLRFEMILNPIQFIDCDALSHHLDLIAAKSLEVEVAKERLSIKKAQLSDLAISIEAIYSSTREKLEAYVLPLTGGHQKAYEEFGLLGIHETALEETDWIQIQFNAMQLTLDELSLTLATNKDLYVEEVYTVIHNELDAYRKHANYYGGEVYYAVGYYSNESGTQGASILNDIKTTLSSNISLLKTIEPSIDTLTNLIETLPSNWINFGLYADDSEKYNRMKAISGKLLGEAYSGSQASEDSIKDILSSIKTNLKAYQTDILFDYTDINTERETMTFSEVSGLLETELGIKVPHFDTIIDGERLPSKQKGSSNLFEFYLPSEVTLSTGFQIYELSQQIGNYFLEGLDDALSWVYLNEYILSTFSCFTDGFENKNATITGINFDNHVFDTEVEYIIFGDPVAYKNLMFALGFIFLIRMVMNMIHIYISPEKMKSITELATLIAGWWSFEIGVAPVALLIIFVWSLMETVVDLVHLIKGESVPLLKNAGNWETDFDGLLREKTKGEQEVANKISVMWAYKDYLRVLLYLPLATRDTKIYRLLDLIQLNLSHSRKEDIYLEDYCYEIKSATELNVNPLFLDFPFIPSTIKEAFTGGSYKVRGSYCYQ